MAKHPLEPCAARGERLVPQVLITVAENVECDERYPSRSRWARRLGQVYAILQPLKTSRLAGRVKCDDFSVQDSRPLELLRKPRESGNKIGKLRCLLVSQPGPDVNW